MDAAEFRQQGYALVDWIADYLEGVERFPVASPLAPGEVRAMLPPSPPAEPEPFEAVLADLDRIVVPGLTHWQHPSFFAYFPANVTYPSILGELASAGLGVQGMLWATSPACTEVEQVVLDWMVELLGLPDHFRNTGPGGGVIQDSASSATLCAILAARERATDGRSNAEGANGRLVAYATSQAHSSIEKGLRIAGIGSDNLRLVDVDDALRHAARRAGRGGGRGPRRRPHAVPRGGHRRHHLVAGLRPGARRSPTCAGARTCGSTSTARWPAWAPSSRRWRGSRTASTRSTPTARTPTSGWA